LGRVRVRWWIFIYMFLFAVLAFMQRNSLNVATEQIQSQLRVSQLQVFMLMWAYQLMYSMLQVPAGYFGQRLGARWVFVLLGALTCLATVATPLAPMVLSGTLVIGAMVLAQAVLGSSQAPLFPVMTGVFETWFPSSRWGFVNGLSSSAMHVGSSIAAPLVVALTAALGWQQALLWMALPMALLTVCWARYGRDRPRQHPLVTAQELKELARGAHQSLPPATLERLLRLIHDRNIALLTLSYLCMNYAFFLLMTAPFLYLTQERHLSHVDGGWLAMLPPAGAAVGAYVGGDLADRFCARFGLRWGLRVIPLISLPLSGALLLLAVHTGTGLVTVACFVLAYGLIEINEGPFGAAVMQIARADTMPGFGAINTGGSLGGVVCYPILGYLSGRGDRIAAFAIGTGFCVVAGALWWLLVRADEPFTLSQTTVTRVARRDGRGLNVNDSSQCAHFSCHGTPRMSTSASIENRRTGTARIDPVDRSAEVRSWHRHGPRRRMGWNSARRRSRAPDARLRESDPQTTVRVPCRN
jgi:MFS transporter, ACS family, glucarate transporter